MPGPRQAALAWPGRAWPLPPRDVALARRRVPARNAEPRAGRGGEVPADSSPAGLPSGPGAPPGVRASDADRDRVVDVLRAAAGDGRLTADEFNERMEAALSSRTLGELAVLTADLAGGPGGAGNLTGTRNPTPSSRGELHPPALTDPYVTVSRYTALVVLITRLAVLTESRPSGRRTGAVRPRPAPTPCGLSSVSAIACTSSASTASGSC
jgi:hypothetical protein